MRSIRVFAKKHGRSLAIMNPLSWFMIHVHNKEMCFIDTSYFHDSGFENDGVVMIILAYWMVYSKGRACWNTVLTVSHCAYNSQSSQRHTICLLKVGYSYRKF